MQLEEVPFQYLEAALWHRKKCTTKERASLLREKRYSKSILTHADQADTTGSYQVSQEERKALRAARKRANRKRKREACELKLGAWQWSDGFGLGGSGQEGR